MGICQQLYCFYLVPVRGTLSSICLAYCLYMFLSSPRAGTLRGLPVIKPAFAFLSSPPPHGGHCSIDPLPYSSPCFYPVPSAGTFRIFMRESEMCMFLSSPSCGDIINVVTAHKSLCFYSVPSAGDIFSSSDIMMDSMFLFSPPVVRGTFRHNGGYLTLKQFLSSSPCEGHYRSAYDRTTW